MREIKTTNGLKTLLARYEKANASVEWLKTIKGCINEGLTMDSIDYLNTPSNLRPLWKGLK